MVQKSENLKTHGFSMVVFVSLASWDKTTKLNSAGFADLKNLPLLFVPNWRMILPTKRTS